MSSFPAKLMAAIVAVLLLVCDFSATSASVPYDNYNFSLLSDLVWIGISSCNARQQVLHLSYLVQFSHFSPIRFYSIWSYPFHFGPIQSIGSIRSTLVQFSLFDTIWSTLVLCDLFLPLLSYSVLFGPIWSTLVLLVHSVYFGLI